jgi:GDPmannose 4,6-dehydratase
MNKEKTAVITGITGQDGAYLAKLLLSKGYKVYGTYRRLSTPNFWRLQYLGIHDQVEIIPLELSDSSSIISALKRSNPDEFYNLAAQSFVGSSFENPMNTSNVSGLGVVRILEVIRQYHPDIRFYQASTSEMYGDGREGKLNENSRFEPSSPYAAAKLMAHNSVKIYRKSYDLFLSNGILFNHESPLRGLEFVTRKITNEVAKIKLGISESISLGNIKSFRDWGYAPDYVEGMWRILQHDEPLDIVLATDTTYTVESFLKTAFDSVDLNFEDYLRINKKYYRPLDVDYLRGDFSKAKEILGWEPTVKFEELVAIMVKEDIKRWTSWKKGEFIPWDAFHYPSEDQLVSKEIRD